MDTLPNKKSQFCINGPAGNIELLYVPSDRASNNTVMICHPHPLFGGTMHNKVVYTLAKTYEKLGFNTLRFNFRGVGKSSGQFDNGTGEHDDALHIYQWLYQIAPQQSFHLAGFSFGAYVSAKLAQTIQPKSLVSVAPPVERFDFTPITDIHCPWIVIQGEADDIVSSVAVLQWQRQGPIKTHFNVPDADHFFHGHLNDLSNILTNNSNILVE